MADIEEGSGPYNTPQFTYSSAGPSTRTLCTVCRSVFADHSFKQRRSTAEKEEYTTRQPFHESKASVQRALDLRCAICSQLDWRLDDSFSSSSFRLWKRHQGKLVFYELFVDMSRSLD